MNKSRKLLAAIAIITAVVSVFNTAMFMKDSFLYDLSDLPYGTKIAVSVSPERDYIVNLYSVENEVGSGIRAEVLKDGSAENIYWETGISSGDVKWVDSETVLINGVSLKIGRDTYDTRRFTENLSEDTPV